MEQTKKYINLFFIIIFGFHSSLIVGSEFTYVPFSVSQAIETTSTISGIISENSRMILVVSAAALLGSTLYLGKDKVSEWAERKYSLIETNIKKECVQNLKQFEDNSLKNRFLLRALKPLASGAQEYWEYNNRHMGIAAILIGIGKLIGHSYVTGSVSTLVLVKGWWDQSLVAVKKVIEDIKQNVANMQEENKELHKKTHQKVSDIDGKVNRVLKNLEDTKIAIQTQITDVEKHVTDTIQDVGDKVVELSAKLGQMPQQIIDLAQELEMAKDSLKDIKGTNQEIVEQNKIITSQVAVLSQKFSEVFDNYTVAIQSLDAWHETLINQMTTLSETTQKQMTKVSEQVRTQDEKFDNLKSSMDSQFQKCFDDAKQQNQLLHVLEKAQESHGTQFIEFLEKIKKNEQQYQRTLCFVQKLAEDEEGRAVRYAEMVTKLNEMNQVNQYTVNTFCSSMEALESRINGKINQLDKKITNDLDSFRQETTVSINTVCERMEPLGQKVETINQDVIELKELLVTHTKQINQLLIYCTQLQGEIKQLRETGNKTLSNTEDIKKTLSIQSNHFLIEEDLNFSVPFNHVESSLPADPFACLLAKKQTMSSIRYIAHS